MAANKKSQSSKDGDAAEPEIWSTLLDSVAGGKRLPEKHVILLGSSPSTQRDFLEVLANENRKPQQKGQRSRAPVSNEFALGYTYLDVLDADHEDILARLSFHTLPFPSRSFVPLLASLLTPTTAPESLLVILLDWVEPWSWTAQLSTWIRIVKDSIEKVDEATKDAMETVMREWEQKRRGGAHDAGPVNTNSESMVNIPLGQGEWDDALGIPLCVVCHNAEKIDVLERQYSWREEEFDFLLQFLRTILLKHGASLVYTSNTVPNSVPLLLQSSLRIHSLLSREPLEHNVVDRDKILIPPNWDSWGKIKVLREGFDVEGVCNSWSEEARIADTTGAHKADRSGVIAAFQDVIKNPEGSPANEDYLQQKRSRVELETPAMQDFLARQLDTMEQLKVEEDAQRSEDAKKAGTDGAAATQDGTSTHVGEQIGPVQFNMGGIQVDAEDVLRRIREDALDQTPDKRPASASVPSAAAANPIDTSTPRIDPSETQQLSNFFSSLIKRGTSTNPGTPQGKES